MRIEKGTGIKNVLKIMCPGTQLREGLENILRAKTGGLIVIGDDEEVMKLVPKTEERVLKSYIKDELNINL